MADEARVEIERLLAGLRVGPHDGVGHAERDVELERCERLIADADPPLVGAEAAVVVGRGGAVDLRADALGEGEVDGVRVGPRRAQISRL